MTLTDAATQRCLPAFPRAVPSAVFVPCCVPPRRQFDLALALPDSSLLARQGRLHPRLPSLSPGVPSLPIAVPRAAA